MKNGVFLKNGVYAEESGYIGSKKKRKKKDNSAHLYRSFVCYMWEYFQRGNKSHKE